MNNKISLQELSEELAIRSKHSKKASELFVRQFFDAIYENVLKEKVVKVKGFGTFKLVEVQDRESVNVNTGERIVIPGHSKVTFTPDNALRDRVNKPFADFQTVIINPDTPIEAMEYGQAAVEEIENAAPTQEETKKGFAEEESKVVEQNDSPIVIVESQPEQDEEVTTIAESLEEKEVIIPAEEASIVPKETIENPDEFEAAEEEEEPVMAAEEGECVVAANESVLGTSEQKSPSNSRKTLYVIIVLLLMAGSYLVGNFFQLPFRNTEETTKTTKAPEKKIDSKPVETDSLIRDSIEEKEKDIVTKPGIEDLQKNAASFKQVPGGRFLIVGTRGTHVMRSGDGLYSIARKEYGGNEFAQYIIVHNDFADPNNIPIGHEVKLPELLKIDN